MSVLDPLIVGDSTLPSRVMFGPIATNLADGRRFSDRHRAFYRERAAGGCGIIVTEHASVHESDWPYERSPDASQAGPGWRSIAEACSEFGTIVVAGLSHAGGQSTSAFSQRELWAPSDEPDVNTREVPKIMEQADIDAVVAGFGNGAALAMASGLAGVEVNAGQRSLIRQFLSGLTNRRDDVFGQDRVLLASQVIDAVRANLGTGLLGLRLSCDELAPWAGITPETAAELAAELSPLVDYLVVERGAIFSVPETRPTAHHPPGFNLDLVAGIRAAVDGACPVFAQGSIVSVDQAEAALADERCDAVEMTRAQLAEADLVAKARRGDDARPCVRCNQLCNVQDNRNPIIACIANPRCGHETVEPPEPQTVAVQSRRAPSGDDGVSPDVIVVGGGPAGLEAARVSARRGLTVRLFESAERLGGMAATAAVAPAHQPLEELVAWLESDARHHGVDIHLGTTVWAEDLNAHEGPVVLATGSVAAPREYRVAPNARVVDGPEVLAAMKQDQLDSLLDAESILIWDPIGGPAGVAAAELLAHRRPTVQLVTSDAVAGNQLSLTGDLAGANTRLQQAGVTIVRRQRLLAVTADSVDLVHVFTGERSTVPADIVVDASARHPEDGHWRDLDTDSGSDGDRTVIRVGDAVAPRTVAEAIRDGRRAAMALPVPTTTAGATTPSATGTS